MVQEFHFPRSPEDLLNPQHRGLHVQEQIPYDSALANGIVNDLRFKDTTRIVEQEFFDGLFSVFRNFDAVQSNFKSALCDVFNENIMVIATDVESEKEPQVLDHQCLKVFIFFLHWLWDAGTRKDKKLMEKKAGKEKKTKGRKPVAADSEEWDWLRDLYHSLRNFARITRIGQKLKEEDVSSSRPSGREKDPINHLCLDMVLIALRIEEPAKVARIREEIVNVGACCVRNLGMAESLARELVALLPKCDHVAEVIAEIAAKVETSGKHDMTREILKAISANSAADLSIQWDITNGKSIQVRGISKTIDALARHVPVALKKHWAFLMPYLDCSVHMIRCSLVSALGRLVLVESELMGSTEKGLVDEERSLRFQDRALGILMERLLDVSPYTRVRTLGVWTDLVQNKVIPIGHYVPVAEAGFRHLSDRAATVQKAAISLLKAMLEYNPFSADLRSWRFKNTLEIQKARLLEMESDTSGHLALTQGEGEDEGDTQMAGSTNLEQVRAVVASLTAGFEFSKLIEKSVTTMKQILTGPSPMATQEAIDFVSICPSFRIEGLDDAVRMMLTLIFAPDRSVQSKVIAAFIDIYIDNPGENSENPEVRGNPMITANNLVGLTLGATVGEMLCLEELVEHLCKKGQLADSVALALILIANKADRDENAKGEDDPLSPRSHLVESKRARGAIQILTMGINQWRHVLVRRVGGIIQIFHSDNVDGIALEYTCTLLKRIGIDGLAGSEFKSVVGALLMVILNDNMPETSWYGASTMAIDALIALYEKPEQLGLEIVQKFDFLSEDDNLQGENRNGPQLGDSSQESPKAKNFFIQALSRYFFIGAHDALKAMAHFEKVVAETQQSKRKSQGSRSNKRSSWLTSMKDNHQALEQGKENESGMNGSTGIALKSLEVLEKMKEQWTNPGTVFGDCAARVSQFCLNLDRLLASPPVLMGSALMSLTKFMAISAPYCERHLRLVFTLVRKSEVPLSIRQNFIVSIQDLVKGYPNMTDPWMGHIYGLLDDPKPEFRQDCLQTLVHLMLSDMIKIKGAIGKVALLLEDKNHETANLAKQFFAQLAKRTVRNVNPITNLLPEILSGLLNDRSFDARLFQPIVRQLLQYTGSDRSGEQLIKKICQALKGERDSKISQGLMYTLRMMNMTEKGMRNFMDLLPCYAHTLGNKETLSNLMERIGKSKRSAKSGEYKTALDEFEHKARSISAELVAERVARQAETQRIEEDAALDNGTTPNGDNDCMDDVDAPTTSGQPLTPSQTANPNLRPNSSPTISLAAGIAQPPHLKDSNRGRRGVSSNEIATVMENDDSMDDDMSIDSPVAFPTPQEGINGASPSSGSQLEVFVRGREEGGTGEAMDAEEGGVTDRLGRMSLTPPPLRKSGPSAP